MSETSKLTGLTVNRNRDRNISQFSLDEGMKSPNFHMSVKKNPNRNAESANNSVDYGRRDNYNSARKQSTQKHATSGNIIVGDFKYNKTRDELNTSKKKIGGF